MFTAINRSCVLLLAVPIVALAKPVAVTTHSAGTIVLNSVSLGQASSVMNVLGLNPLTTTGPVPYELTLHSGFDTDTMIRPDDFWAHDYGGDVVIDYRIGTQVYHYAGRANSTVNLYAQSANVEEYGHRIWLDTPNYSLGFYHSLLGPSGSMGIDNPLAPLDADERDGVSGSAGVHFSPYAPDAPSDLGMSGGGPTISVHVAVVPEPATFVLFMSGLLTLGLVRRFGGVVAGRVSADASQLAITGTPRHRHD
jgi:hypothetical protein